MGREQSCPSARHGRSRAPPLEPYTIVYTETDSASGNIGDAIQSRAGRTLTPVHGRVERGRHVRHVVRRLAHGVEHVGGQLAERFHFARPTGIQAYPAIREACVEAAIDKLVLPQPSAVGYVELEEPASIAVAKSPPRANDDGAVASDMDEPRWDSVSVPVASTNPALSAVRIVAMEGVTPRDSVNDAATTELAGMLA